MTGNTNIRWKEEKGFTLVEVMIAIVILTIMVAIAYPSFMKTIAVNQVRSCTVDLQANIKVTRSMAIKEATRNYLMVFNPSAGSYSFGYDSDSDGVPDGFGTGSKQDVTVSTYSSLLSYGSDASNGPATSAVCSGAVPANGIKGFPGGSPTLSFGSDGAAASTGCVFVKDTKSNNYLLSVESLVGNVAIWKWEGGNVWKKTF
jgi:type IV fimbrial biogenesis protein FimT